jgi:hypothetical protein
MHIIWNRPTSNESIQNGKASKKYSVNYDTDRVYCRVYDIKHFLIVQLVNNYVLDLIDIHQKHK